MERINQRGFSAAEVMIVAVVVILLGGAGWYVTQKKDDKQIVPVSSDQNSSSQAKDGKKATNSELTGTWKTECLVPKADEQWAEKHQFVIEGDKATHTRWSDDSGANNCDTPNMTLVDKYTYTVPASGQINLKDSEKGYTIFDVYEAKGATLEFGHGVRLNYTGANKINGDTEANRIDSLNTYLVYKKQ